MDDRQPHEVLRPVINSGHWDLLEDYLKNRKDTLIKQVLSCGPEELKGFQGAVRELDTLLNLKATLHAGKKS